MMKKKKHLDTYGRAREYFGIKMYTAQWPMRKSWSFDFMQGTWTHHREETDHTEKKQTYQQSWSGGCGYTHIFSRVAQWQKVELKHREDVKCHLDGGPGCGEKEIRKSNESDMKAFSTLLVECSEGTVAILGDRFWPQTEDQEEDWISNKCSYCVWKMHNSAQIVEGVAVSS